MDVEVSFSAEKKVGKFVVAIGKKIESEDNGAVGRVLEGDNAVLRIAFVDGFKYI